jgi:tRNA modification GTPase
MAYIEAVIDFPDEDVPDSEVKKTLPDLLSLASEMKNHLNDAHRGERLREGIHVVILGAPNAGKSSLMNALSRRDVAIVSQMAGTTRDILETHLNIGGYPVILSDTAGLRDIAGDMNDHAGIEGEGIRRALSRAREADIKILLFDGTQTEADAQTLSLKNENSILVLTKSDQCHPEGASRLKDPMRSFAGAQDDDVVEISSTTGAGLEQLLSRLTGKLAALYAASRDTPSLTRARHRAAVEECLHLLQSAMESDAPELMAEELRLAARAIGRITGRVDVEDLLDVIFRDFCIGK